MFESFFKVQSEFSDQSTTKKEFLRTTILKLFMDQSEVSALPAGCMNQSEVSALHAGCMNKSEVSALHAGCMNKSKVSALHAGCMNKSEVSALHAGCLNQSEHEHILHCRIFSWTSSVDVQK